MERRLQRHELVSSGPRKRMRKVGCCIPDCVAEVYRSNLFPLCINHLLRIWKIVDGMERPSPWALPESTIWATGDASHVVTEEEVEARRLAARQRQREIATTPGTLYVLDTANDTVKIGWTKRGLWQRLDEYPPHFRLIVSVPGTRADERDVHRSLKMFRAAKQEWYFVKPEVVRQINSWIALKNTIDAQTSTANKARYGASNPETDFTPYLLPKFVDLASWKIDGRIAPYQAPDRPAPKSRSSARRVG